MSAGMQGLTVAICGSLVVSVLLWAAEARYQAYRARGRHRARGEAPPGTGGE